MTRGLSPFGTENLNGAESVCDCSYRQEPRDPIVFTLLGCWQQLTSKEKKVTPAASAAAGVVV